MPTFRLVLEYDGRDFEGWQLQPGDRRTVQGTLSQAVARITGAPPGRLAGAGRTDSGVHAEGQVAALRVDTSLDAAALQRALNGVLPPDVAVVSVEVAPDDFDPRRGAVSKLYRYQVWNAPRRSPLRVARALHVPQPLDVGQMNAAGAALVGRHDFASFQASGSSVVCTVRDLGRCEWLGESGGDLALECEGSGFLRHMVRNLAGTLLEVGLGRRRADSIPELLSARDRGLAGPTAAACALTLVRVDYGQPEAVDSA